MRKDPWMGDYPKESCAINLDLSHTLSQICHYHFQSVFQCNLHDEDLDSGLTQFLKNSSPMRTWFYAGLEVLPGSSAQSLHLKQCCFAIRLPIMM